MDKVIAGPAGGMLKQVGISYQSVPAQFLRPSSNVEQPLLLALYTRYGIIYATIRMDPDSWDSPFFILDFDTRAPSVSLEEDAYKNFGANFEALPKDVVWSAGAGVDYSIKSTTPKLAIKSSMTLDEYYSSGMSGRVWEHRERVATMKFIREIIPQITRELAELKVLKQGAVLSLIKFKTNLEKRGYAQEQVKDINQGFDTILKRIIDGDDKAAILRHADRDIRLIGLSILAQHSRANKAPRR